MIQPTNQSSSDQKQPFVVCADRKPMTFGSLFAGIGGIDLGFERAGLECRWQVEIDEYARKVLAKHWPDVHRHDDVRTWPPMPHYVKDRQAYWNSGDGVRVRKYKVDIIAGGFPCQDISYAGKGAGLDGERSGLFYEVARIVGEMEPRFVVLENVAALLTRGMGDVLGTLASLGYDAEWHCIPAAAVGAPHIRDRVFIIARRIPDTECEGSLPSTQRGLHCGQEGSGPRHVDVERLCGPVPDAEGIGRGTRRTRRTAGVGEGQEDASVMANSKSTDDRSGIRLAIEGQVCESRKGSFGDGGPWAVEPDVGRVADGVPARVDRLRGLGNAVVPQVAEWIARRIVESSNSMN